MTLYVICTVDELVQRHVFLQILRFFPASFQSTNNEFSFFYHRLYAVRIPTALLSILQRNYTVRSLWNLPKIFRPLCREGRTLLAWTRTAQFRTGSCVYEPWTCEHTHCILLCCLLQYVCTSFSGFCEANCLSWKPPQIQLIHKILKWAYFKFWL